MSKYKFYQQLKAEEKDLLETLNALQILIKRYEVENQDIVKSDKHSNTMITSNISEVNQNEESFDQNMSISKKLLFALKLLSKGTSREVAEKAYQLDKSRTKEQWLDDSRYYLSKFYNEKKLTVVPGTPYQRGHVYKFPSTSSLTF